MTTILKDVEDKDVGSLTQSDAEEAFLNRWKSDASEPSEDDEGAEEPEVDETDDGSDQEEVEAEEGDNESEDPNEDEDTDEEDGEETLVEDENAKVKIKVGEEELSVSIKDLKRLYGQEASLTKKSQEVAAKRKEVEDQGSYHLLGLQKLYERAVERYKPYAEIDMLVASKQMDAEELSILRQEAGKAYEDVRFLEQELKGFAGAVEQQRQKMIVEQAKVAVQALQDPDKGIPNFSPEVYNSILEYAVNNGMAREAVNQIVDPVIIKTLWKAMAYDKGKTVATVKKQKAPTKVLKSKTNVQAQKFAKSGETKSLQKLRSTGSRDDAANAFLSRWNLTSDD